MIYICPAGSLHDVITTLMFHFIVMELDVLQLRKTLLCFFLHTLIWRYLSKTKKK